MAGGRLPAGKVTFLFTDIEGSTAHLRELGEVAYAQALAEHRQKMRAAFGAWGGVEVDTQGDAFLAAFSDAQNAVAAAVQAQRAHLEGPLRARMGIHTGRPIVTEEGYVGIDLHRGARVAAAAHGGQVLLSQDAVEAAAGALPADIRLRELGRYRLKDLTEPQPLYQVDATGLATSFPRLRTLEMQANNLPIQLTPLVGRRAEIATAIELLGRHRLVTLVGPGGTGKTRVALQLAAELADQYPDGVWFVDLAPVTDADGVAFAVAAALSVAGAPETPILRTIADTMRRRQALVVLDNCEQVVAACAAVAQALLAASPATRVLATSRELLGVPGEALYRLPSLTVAGERLDGSEMLASEAVQLFLERAQAARHDLALTRSQVAIAAQICRRVDGIPLAIELAAARARSLSLEEIDRRLDDRFRLLTGGARTALPRQQTLRGLVDWSYDLLDEDERTLFERLSVFAGGWDADLASAVCFDDALPEPEVLDILMRLVDKSMVVVRVGAADGEPTRYRMLDTLRAYAAIRLAERGEDEPLRWRLRHLDVFVQSALAAEQEFRTSMRVRRQDVRAAFDDMRVAFSTALERDPAKALPLAAALGLLWSQHRGRVSEASSMLAAAMAAAPDAPDAWRAYALQAASRVETIGTRYDLAAAMANECMVLTTRHHDEIGTALALRSLAVARIESGEVDAAEQDLLRALEIQRAADMEECAGHSLISLGVIASMRGQHDLAIAYSEQACAIYRRLGSDEGLSIALNNIAAEADAGGDTERARRASTEGVAVSRRLNDRQAIGYSLLTLAHIDWSANDIQAMRQHARDGLTTMRELESRRGIAYGLESAAVVALHDGDPTAALVLLGAASALRRRARTALDPGEQREIDALTASARRAVAGEAADAAWQSGEALDGDQSVALALRHLGATGGGPVA